MNKHHSRREGAAKRAILVVSFGTSYMDTLQKPLRRLNRISKKPIPTGSAARFHQRMIINKLKDRDHIYIITLMMQ